MTAVQPYQQPPGNGAVTAWGRSAPPAPANRRVVSLTEWADAARAAHEVSEVLCRTPFVPVAYRDNPYAATAAILAGDELGFSPMASINAFDVIEGRAAPKAITLRAVVQSAGHEIWTEETTDTRAVVRGRRIGSSHIEESVWTIARARTMKLSDRKAWREQPTAMLLARATSECCRRVAADAILGIPYSAEEAADDIVDAVEPPAAQATQATQRTVQRRTATKTSAPRVPAGGAATPAAAAPETPPQGPPLPGEDGYDTDPPDDLEEPADAEPAVGDDIPRDDPTTKATTAQNRLMHKLFREAECTDRAERLQLTGLLLSRPLATSAGLTVRDATVIIDGLGELKAKGHPDGLSGAVGDLLNEDDLRREALQQADADAEASGEQTVDDAPAGQG